MNLKQQFLTENNCYKEGKRQPIKGIMVHSTGANNPWLRRYVAPDDGILGKNEGGNHWNTPLPGGRSVCVHAFIGKDKNGEIRTYQTLPWDMVGWHSGSGKQGSANTMGYIGFEICEDNLENKDYFLSVYQEAVQLCAFLCTKYKLNPMTAILCHSEGYEKGIASNHADVMHWFPRHKKSMDTFRKDVAALLTPTPAATLTPNNQPYKDIIQQNCKFSDPKIVFAFVDQFPYATELYRKWALSYSGSKAV